LFGLLNYLSAHKLPKAAIKLVLDAIVESYFPCFCLSFRNDGKKWQFEWGVGDEVPWEEYEAQEELPALPVTYCLEVKQLIGWVNGRIAKLRGKV